MEFTETKAAAAREIALAFGVPPMLLGLPGDNTYANYQEANRALWRLTILPLVTKIAAGLQAHLQNWWPELSLEIDRDAIPALAADRERLWAQLSAASRSEEHTSELQSLMRISYAVFCLKKKK